MQTNKKNINKKIIIILGETKGEQQIKTKVKNRLDQPEKKKKKESRFFRANEQRTVFWF